MEWQRGSGNECNSIIFIEIMSKIKEGLRDNQIAKHYVLIFRNIWSFQCLINPKIPP